MDKNIVITGMGTVNPIGNNVNEFLEGIISGKSGIKKNLIEETEYSVGQVEATNKELLEKLDNSKNYNRVGGRAARFAGIAAKEALIDANLFGNIPLDNTIACYIGVGGNQAENDVEVTKQYLKGGKARPTNVSKIISDTIPGLISIDYNLKGPNIAVTTACSSGTTAIRSGMEQILLENSNIAIVGGCDASVILRDLNSFNAAGALSKNGISMPFDKERDGFVMGEGAGVSGS